MGKRIIQQARGHGSLTYRVRRRAYSIRIGYLPSNIEGKATVQKLIDTAGHTAPLAKMFTAGKGIFYVPAFKNMAEGQEIEIGKAEKEGDIAKVKDIPAGTRIFNIEARPGDGGKFIRTSGTSGIITKKAGNKWHAMKSRNKLWPRTSAVKMNAIDHPFGSGRGKRIKSKIAKRNAPAGKRVGLIRPRRTGRKKR